jgi:hypothetical protein
MLTWLNKQGVRSDRGFVFQFTGRFSAEYREGGRIATLEIESGLEGGLPCIILDPSAFSTWDDGHPISVTQREALFSNVKDALEFQGLKMVVQAGT